MIPIQLKIKGLYSFKEEQTIDFSKLLQSHIFGIFGKVGSGKSTILEAITYSLYGESERLNSKDNRGYNMMNLQSNELFIEFEFLAGHPQKKYKTVVIGKRNKRNFDDVKSYSRSLYQREKDEWIPIDKKRISEIIGLSNVNFKRTIIIPQGKFQEFLGLGHKDRSDMLKEIFNLQKFDLSFKISALAKQNADKITNLVGQLQQLEDVSSKILKSFQAVLKSDKKRYQSLETIQEKDEKQLKKLAQLKILFEDTKLAQLDYEKFISDYQKRYQQIEAEAKKAQYCIEFFKNNLNQKRIQEKDVFALQKSISDDRIHLEKIETQLKTLKTQFKKIKTDVEKKEYYHKIILDIEKSIAMAEYLENKKSKEQLLQSKMKQFNKIENDIENTQKTEKEIHSKLMALQKDLPDFIELNKIRDWFEIEKDIKQDIFDLESQSKEIQNQIKTNIEQKTSIITPLAKEIKGLAQLSLEKSIETLHQFAQQTQTEISKIHLEEKHLFAQNELIGHAKNLKDGAPCPICGSLEHPDILKTKDLDSKMAATKTRRKAMENTVEQSNQIINQLTDLFSSERDFNSRLTLIEKKLSELNKSLKEHQKTRFWKDVKLDSLSAIQKMVDQAQILQTQIDSLTKEQSKNGAALDILEKQLEKLRPEIEKIRKETHQFDSKIELLESQINPENYKKFQTYSIDELNTYKTKYQNLIIKNDEEYTFLESQLKISLEQQTKTSTTLNLNIENLKKEENILQKLNEIIEKQLQKSEFEHLKEIEQILDQNNDPKVALDRVEKYKKEVFSKKEKLDGLLQKTKGISFDETEFVALQSDFDNRKKEIQTLIGQIAKSNSKIEELTQKVKEKQNLEKELKLLQIRAENINTLNKLFKGQGFVNYISSVYLQNIIKAANERFQNLTKHQLSLELAEDNSFNIRDMLNDGKIRNIKTLSGGQTFQAALSLALALADNIHELTKSKQNFFFLDEGFGTQDNDSIEAVFQTLKALRKENRTVGIISHVDLLQQEIDVHLMVKKDDERGSLVEGSW